MNASEQPGESVATVKRRAAADACDRHDGVLPAGYRLYFRRYGSHGGRWRGVGPNGWVEVGGPNAEETATDELWWMVAADESDAAREQAETSTCSDEPATAPASRALSDSTRGETGPQVVGRWKGCIEAWPECIDGDYNPACCRFPKSCSCDVWDLQNADPRYVVASPTGSTRRADGTGE